MLNILCVSTQTQMNQQSPSGFRVSAGLFRGLDMDSTSLHQEATVGRKNRRNCGSPALCRVAHFPIGSVEFEF